MFNLRIFLGVDVIKYDYRHPDLHFKTTVKASNVKKERKKERKKKTFSKV